MFGVFILERLYNVNVTSKADSQEYSENVAYLASQVYGLYGALIYFTPLVGGFVADRYTGQRPVILFGAIVMCAGHIFMAIESLFVFAMLLIIIGMAGFKANVTTQVGLLYDQNPDDNSNESENDRHYPAQADSDIDIDGMNGDTNTLDNDKEDDKSKLLTSGGGGDDLDGVLDGNDDDDELDTALINGGNERNGKLTTDSPKDTSSLRDSGFLIFYAGINVGAMFAPIVCGLLREHVGTESGFIAAGIGMGVSFMTYFIFGKNLPSSRNSGNDRNSSSSADESSSSLLADVRREWKCITAIFILCSLTTMYHMVYGQDGNTLAQFGNDEVYTPFPYEFIQSINPFFILGLTFPFMALWKWQSSKNCEPSSVIKMSFGAALLAIAYAMLAFFTAIGQYNSTHWLVLVLAIFVWTVGEMYISPTGLSFVSRYDIARVVKIFTEICSDYGERVTAWDQRSLFQVPDVFSCFLIECI